MERNITIISTKTNGRKTFRSSATTLKELKADCDRYGVNYAGMTFFEGTTKTEMKSDDSLLPTNIRYKDKITNDLVFMLTAPQAKVRSGEMSRSEAYEAIKKLGLQSECVSRFGKNMTQCKTADLINLVEENKSGKKNAKPAPQPKAQANKPEPKEEKKQPKNNGKKDEGLDDLMESLVALVNPLKNVLTKISEYTGVEVPVSIEVKELDSNDVEDIIKSMR